ncbi:MAG: HdeD family acid-resistance protein [Pseudomonadota bacterium]
MTDQPPSLDQAADAMRAALRATVAKNSTLFLIQAALMILAGLAALISPLLITATLVLFLGWLLIFSGGLQVISLIGATHVPHFWLQLLSAVLSVLIGYLFVKNPGAGIGTLALLMIVFFMIEGMAKVVFSLSVRPLANWGWVLGSGVLGIVISLYLITNPALSVFLLGILIGLQLITQGVAIGYMAWQVKKAG